MQVIKIDLPKEHQNIIICPISDVHLGSPECDYKMLEKEIEFIKNTPNAYCILNGDIIDNTTRNSIGDVYSQRISPQQQLGQAVQIFKPIKDKIIAITNGNHEERTWREAGIDIMGCLAMNLGCDRVYAKDVAVLFIKFGNKCNDKSKKNGYVPIQFAIYCNHGNGGGRKVGAKANRLDDDGMIVDVDIVIVGHTHQPLAFKKTFYRVDYSRGTVTPMERLFVNSGSFLNYGGYAERASFQPNAKIMPKIALGIKNHKDYIEKTMQVIM